MEHSCGRIFDARLKWLAVYRSQGLVLQAWWFMGLQHATLLQPDKNCNILHVMLMEPETGGPPIIFDLQQLGYDSQGWSRKDAKPGEVQKAHFCHRHHSGKPTYAYVAVCTAQDDTSSKRHACTTLTQQHPQDMWGTGIASHSTLQCLITVCLLLGRLSQWQLIHDGSALFLFMLLHLQIRRTFL